MGSADAGHYLSYINVDGENWLEFNDGLIKQFDLAQNMEAKCFGAAKK
jgi:hypothetical protein